MKKKIYFFIVSIIILTNLSLPVYGKSNNIGIIDYSIVESLHPLKDYFLYSPNIYLKPIENIEEININSEKRDKKVEEQSISAKNSIKKINYKKTLISKIIRLIEENVSKKNKKLRIKFAEIYSMRDCKERTDKLSSIRKKMRLLKEQTGYKKATYEVQFEKCNKKIFNIKNEIFSINYLNKNKTEKLEKRIKDEIKRAIKKTCKIKRIDTVINITALKTKRERNWKKTVDDLWLVPCSKWQNFYFIYRSKTDFQQKKVPDFVKSDYKFKILARIKEENKIKYQRLDNLIPYGGTEITFMVLEKILKEYKYPRIKRKLIKEVIHEYKENGEMK